MSLFLAGTRHLLAAMLRPPFCSAVFPSAAAAALSLFFSPWMAAAPLELQQGDRIALVGNATAERMQHSNGLETLLARKFADLDLAFRNLAFAGDEVVTRARSENFGSPDAWLERVKASVVWGFFGYNESFHGLEGLPKFRADLETWVKETKAKNFSGAGTPKIVLFAPLAVEKRPPFNAPGDPEARNAVLAAYAAAIKEVAAATDADFVDLFVLSQQAYAAAKEPLTHNGWQLTDAGDAALAPLIFQALTGEAAPTPDGNMEKLRAAIAEKNRQWHLRYRTVDGYNIYGGRSQMEYESGPGGPKIKNYQVMQEEMSVRDVMTANRDARVWAVAKGGDLKIDDSNVPKVTEIKTNLPGSQPDGAHTYLGGEEAIAKMKLAPGCEVTLFASEEQFPELVNPVQMAWDPQGRLWVAAWRNYPSRTPWSTKGDSLLVFEDTDADGRADKVTTFLDDLNCPTGFQFYKDGVLVMQAPSLWFVRDTDGDGRADWKERVLMGLDSADSHHQTNAMALDPGGAVYLSDGVFHRTQVETARGPVRNVDGAIYRFEPGTGVFAPHVKYGFANPHGKVFDRWGNDLVTDATGNNTYFAPAFSGRIDEGKHRGMKEFWARPSRPCPGTGILSSGHFPDEWQGNFLNLNVIGFQGIYRVKVSEDGSGLRGDTQPDLISSSDPNFRPSAVSIGPEGAIYFCDWSNAIIGHLQHHLRDPNRDHQHGRIYRITYPSRPFLPRVKIAGEPVEALLDLLKSPQDNIRERAKIELGKRGAAEVIAALKKWEAALDPADPEIEHQRTEALWVRQWHHAVDAEALAARLQSPDPRARAAAVRVLGYWREFLPNALALLAPLATDEHPRVRLEVARVASFFDSAEAVNIALATLAQPADYYLDYTLGETMRQLEPVWKKALAEGQPIAPDNAAGIQYIVKSTSAEELLKLPRTHAVVEAILFRPDVPSAARLEALSAQAEKNGTSLASAIVKILQTATPAQAKAADDLAALLPAQGTEALQPMREPLAHLGQEADSARVREAALASVVMADEGWDAVGTAALSSPAVLQSALGAVPLVPDLALRAEAARPLRELVTATPEQLAERFGVVKSAPARFVRIELPRRGTLTLAEVEVLSGGQNIARSGTATQSSTANGGVAARAIDGNTSASWGGGGQTHSAENEDRPWWELDLGRETPVDAVTVFNRHDGEDRLRNRLAGYTLTVLDAARQPLFVRKDLPAPADSATTPVEADPVATLRAAAVRALASTGVEPERSFVLFCELLERGEARPAVVSALRSLPRASWQPVPAFQAAQATLAWLKTLPASERTAPAVVEALQLAMDLAGTSDGDAGRALAKELRGLGVNVFVIRTVREQMRYDTPRLVVEAGKPFEVHFENADAMPHNIVFAQPGTKEAIATAAQVMPPGQLDARGRTYIPPDKMDVIFGASKMLEAGQRETLRLTAPAQPGDYDYVCTFPGHWMIMHGVLSVVPADGAGQN